MAWKPAFLVDVRRGQYGFLPATFPGTCWNAEALCRLSGRVCRLEPHLLRGCLYFHRRAFVFFVMLAEAFARKRTAGDNPWGEGASTLEWTLSSPPPFHQYESLPVVR